MNKRFPREAFVLSLGVGPVFKEYLVPITRFPCIPVANTLATLVTATFRMFVLVLEQFEYNIIAL